MEQSSSVDITNFRRDVRFFKGALELSGSGATILKIKKERMSYYEKLILISFQVPSLVIETFSGEASRVKGLSK